MQVLSDLSDSCTVEDPAERPTAGDVRGCLVAIKLKMGLMVQGGAGEAAAEEAAAAVEAEVAE